MRAKFFASATFAALAGIALAASGTARAAEPLTITHGWVVLSADMSPLVFMKPDILKDYGKKYTVEPIRFKGTSPQITALAAGQLDIASLAYSSFALAIENAHLDDMRIIADGFQDGHPGYGSIDYMVRNDSGIKKVEDLKGKIMGINVIGAAVDIGGRAVLAEHGLRFPHDYSIIEANFPTIGAMLLSGKADFVSMVEPFNFAPAVQKGAHTLFTMRDGMGTSQMIILVARKGFLEKNKAALDDFFDDMVRGIHWMQKPANRQAAIQFVAGVSKLPATLFEPYYLTKKDQYHDPNGIPDLVALQRNIDTQVKFGFLKQSIDVKKYADLSFIERAAQRYAKEQTASAK
jgi:ABC-type nitrate/sulfonate/bicarbonate transport system substrate-binding protein